MTTQSSPVLTGRGLFHLGIQRLFTFGIGFLLFISSRSIGQIKSVQGTIGGEFDKHEYNYPESWNVLTKYRQVLFLGITGNVYHRNVAEFNINTRLMNSNSTIASPGVSSKQHDMYFNFYDVSVNALRHTTTPLFFFIKRDIITNEVTGEEFSTFSNKVLSNAAGARFSFGLNNGSLPRATFSVDHARNESLHPDIPLDQTNRNFQIVLEQGIGTKTNLSLDLIHRTRKDNLTEVNYIAREAHFHGASHFNDANNLSTNVNLLQDGNVSTLIGNSLWNVQVSPLISNQAHGQFTTTQTSAWSNIEGTLNDQIDIAFSSSWRGLVSLSHTEGKSKISGTTIPRRSTTVLNSVTYHGEGEFLLPTLSSFVRYDRLSGLLFQQVVEGQVGGNLSTKGISFVQLSLGDQINLSRFSGNIAQTLIQNSVSAILQSTVIPNLFVNGSGTYSFVDEVDGNALSRRRDLSYMVNTSYQWSHGVAALLSLNYNMNKLWTHYFTNTIHHVSLSIMVPEFIRNCSMEFRTLRLQDVLRRQPEFTTELLLSYSWRALYLTARWVGYSMSSYRRSDVMITLTRPFSMVY